MSDSVSWDTLTSTALVGTARRPYQGSLLEDAAVEVARRRAGRGPVSAPATGRRAEDGGHEPVAESGAEDGAQVHPGDAPERGRTEDGGRAPEEEQAAVGRAAAERLATIMAGRHERLLPEWLAEAARGGRRVPPFVLPELLDRGRRDRSIRAHLGVLAGQRGRWLAGRNPAWAYLLEEPTGETWELGGTADRRAHLRRLRTSDPKAARELLEGTWEQETPQDRMEFVGVLAAGLSMDDEPFLEHALDDRRLEVRQQAANLLTRLPGSALAGRMAARARDCVAITGTTITVDAPKACDRAMERDGIRPKPPRGTGERAWWLQQVIARAPLASWELPPDTLLAMRIPEWDAEMKAGWMRAAVLQRDPEWARAMFAWDPIADLLEALGPEEQQRLAADFVKRHDLDSQLIMVLGGVSPHWREGLATAVLRKILKVAGTQPWNLGELVRLAGERIDPGLADLAGSYSPEPPIQEVAALLRFRADMIKELT
ncbi:DUF5691 domain-containing protein [Nonomuraea cavernae]|uniref:Uncharacterized protein n=1 Tax=Nonomuraea cavernae TaxID=2045107 RepID=A0A917ZI28_9ACTN|nr:DUF5691 domain-containing protein [Nonomuraea cavernae]MCA2190766.1 DUF5691 domain-containing protein [Nonomuraea cavernae]GGO82404.1 hypothetical protein GCM10012289_73560 [Nonomuraea cavernae]